LKEKKAFDEKNEIFVTKSCLLSQPKFVFNVSFASDFGMDGFNAPVDLTTYLCLFVRFLFQRKKVLIFIFEKHRR